MASCGISGPDSIQFRNVIDEFRKYGYSASKIMEAFVEVIEINDARDEIRRQKQEIEEQREILDKNLEEIGFGDMEQLKQVVASLITLAGYGILQEKIISICRNLYSNTNRLNNNWSRPGNWDAGFVNDNNGHGSQGYNNQGYHGYGY